MEDYNHQSSRTHFGFSHRVHGAEHIVSKLEKSVHSLKMSIHSFFDHHKEVSIAEGDVKWKHYDLGNKLGHNHDGEGYLEKKEPHIPPAMIKSGGCVRSNCALWASPPGISMKILDGSALDHEYSNGYAQNYLKETNAQTGYSRSRSRGSVKPRSYVTDIPNHRIRGTRIMQNVNSGY